MVFENVAISIESNTYEYIESFPLKRRVPYILVLRAVVSAESARYNIF